MKPTETATARLCKDLTGREAFGLMVAGYLERAGKKPPTFTDADFDRMLTELNHRPQERGIYCAWWDGFDVIHYLSEAGRRVAMEAVWRLSMFIHWLLEHSRRARALREDPKAMREALTEDLPPTQKLENLIGDFARLYILLEAFGELHGCDTALMMRWERELLIAHVERFNHLAEWIDDDLAYAAYRDGLEPDAHRSNLPRLSIAPADLPADLKERLQAAIEEGHRKRFMWHVLDAFDRPLVEA